MTQPSGWMSLFISKKEDQYLEYLFSLQLVEKSTEIKQFAYRIPDMQASWHQIVEITQLLVKIANSGKKLIAHTTGGNLKSLYLMTPAHKRYASPHANFIILFPNFGSYFIKGFLDRIGVSVETKTAGQYKGSGFEIFTRTGFSPQSRTSMSHLIQGLRKELQEAFTETRNLKEKDKKATSQLLKNQALVQTSDLLKSGFLQSMTPQSYFLDLIFLKNAMNTIGAQTTHSFSPESEHETHKAKAKVKKSKNKEKKLLSERFQEHLSLSGKASTLQSIEKRFHRKDFPFIRLRRLPSIAFVTMEGAIQMGQIGETPKAHSVSALPFCQTFQDVLRNRDEAVFLYINSPGGSADASELLFESIYELSRIKPVFSFLGPVAASGGYYIACATNRIYASSLSITGSIGVIRMRPNLQKLYTKWGVRKDNLTKDPTRDLFSEAGPLSSQTQKMLDKTMLSTYELFLNRVSLGREKQVKEVLKMAEGRVFTGKQFYESKMIDGNLNFIDALEYYKQISGSNASQKYRFNYYPSFKTNIRSLANQHFPLSSEQKMIHPFLSKPFMQGLERLHESNTGRPLSYLPWEAGLQHL